MKNQPALLLDPWTDWPDGFPYAHLEAAGIGVESTQSQIRDAYFELLERGAVTDDVRNAQQQLRIVGRRLLLDAMLYDADGAADLLAMLEDPPQGDGKEIPLQQQIPFSWDV